VIRRAAAAFGLLVALAGVPAARAQDATALLATGIRTYQDLEYDSAVVFLRAALARPAAETHDSVRTRALAYLGATEFYREHRDSAASAFRQLLFLEPRYRPSQLIFPPEVSSLFEEVRSGTRAVAVAVAPVTELGGPGDRMVVRLYATSVHEVSATIVRGQALVMRTLYSGAIGDSLEILWDGRDTVGSVVDSGRAVLRVTSRGPTGQLARTIEVPLEIRRAGQAPLPLPPPPADSLLRPEHTAGGSASRSLLIGLAGAAFAVALPTVVGSGSDASAAPYAVAGAIGIAGIVGARAAARPRPIPENIAANQQLRRVWEQQTETVRLQNQQRAATVRLTIRASAPRVVSP